MHAPIQLSDADSCPILFFDDLCDERSGGMSRRAAVSEDAGAYRELQIKGFTSFERHDLVVYPEFDSGAGFIAKVESGFFGGTEFCIYAGFSGQ